MFNPLITGLQGNLGVKSELYFTLSPKLAKAATAVATSAPKPGSIQAMSAATKETLGFQAEVKQLLELMGARQQRALRNAWRAQDRVSWRAALSPICTGSCVRLVSCPVL
jgi:hypothetical protein